MPERDALDWDLNRSSNSLISKRLQTIVSNLLPLKSRRMYMSYTYRLSRWLHKRLAHNYTQAGMLQPYTIRMSTILRDSGTHQSARPAIRRPKVAFEAQFS